MEPSSGLINRFGNKLRRELLLKQLLILKRIMMLRKWHCAGVKPTVQNLRYTLHFLTALRTVQRNCIDIRAVKLYGLCFLHSAHLVQLLTATHTMPAPALAFPDI